MDLGNMFFTLGLSTKDFDKKMEDEIKKAKNLREEMQNALKGIRLEVIPAHLMHLNFKQKPTS